MTNYEYKDGVLPILVSARVRLSKDQRQELKAAYYQKKNAFQPATAEGRGGLVVSTTYGGSNDLDKALGMSYLVFTDLVNSRDTITLGIILRLQQVLDVEVVSKEQLLDACKNYIDYVYLKAENE